MTKASRTALFLLLYVAVMAIAAILFINFPRLAEGFGRLNHLLAGLFVVGYGIYLAKALVEGRLGSGTKALTRDRPLKFYLVAAVCLAFEVYLIVDLLEGGMPRASRP